MLRPHTTTFILLAACTAACGGSTDPIVCTEQFVFGLTVQVVDSVTGTAQATGSTLTLIEGTYVESTTDSFDGLTLAGAGERPGTYLVSVARAGYHTWTVADVEVTADECHVIPVSMLAELQPIP